MKKIENKILIRIIVISFLLILTCSAIAFIINEFELYNTLGMYIYSTVYVLVMGSILCFVISLSLFIISSVVRKKGVSEREFE